nr:hypothetical protein [Myxococcales bacterium]
ASVLLMAAVGACDPEGSSNDLAQFHALCEGACQAAATGFGCDTEAIRAECPAFCDSIVVSFEDDCLEEYVDLLNCGADEEYQCDDALTVRGLPWPYAASGGACSESDGLYADCLAGQTVP